MKCIFRSPADPICISCQRRGAECVGQQFPEVVSNSLDRSLQIGDRVVRVEALVEKLLQRAPDETEATKDGEKSGPGVLTPVSTTPKPINYTYPQSVGSSQAPAVSSSSVRTQGRTPKKSTAKFFTRLKRQSSTNFSMGKEVMNPETLSLPKIAWPALEITRGFLKSYMSPCQRQKISRL